MYLNLLRDDLNKSSFMENSLLKNKTKKPSNSDIHKKKIKYALNAIFFLDKKNKYKILFKLKKFNIIIY